MNKRIASIGILAGLAVGGGAGLALSHVGGASATDSSNVETNASVPASAAPADPGAPQPGPQGADWTKTALDKLVADGTITQAQEDAVTKALDAARPQGGPGQGAPGRGGPGGGPIGGPGGMNLDVAAKAIGITTDELRTDIKNGQTIAAVATSKKVDPATVIAALVADVKTREAAAVTAGKETQAQADQHLADATTRITDFVDNTKAPTDDAKGGRPGGPGRGAPGGAQGGGSGRGSAPTTTTPTTTAATGS